MLVSRLVGDIRKDILSGVREQRNRVATAMNTTDTAMVCTYATTGIGEQSIVSAGLEDLFVWAVDNATKTLTVARADDSDAGSIAQNSDIFVNSEFSPRRVLNVINDELNSLSGAGLYQVATVELTTSTTAMTYNLTSVTGLIDVQVVYWDPAGADNSWPEVKSWTLRRSQETDDFTSGFALRVDEALDTSRPLRVIYTKGFTALSTLAQDVAAISGLPATALDILKLGAQMRLMGVYEAKRAQTAAQGDTRRAAEVRPGAALGSASGLRQLRRDRINEERALLLKQWPPRRR